MFHLTRHEWIGIQKKHIETSLRTKISPFAAIVCARIFGGFRYLSAAGGEVDWWLNFGIRRAERVAEGAGQPAFWQHCPFWVTSTLSLYCPSFPDCIFHKVAECFWQ